jgi:hypothetical protein
MVTRRSRISSHTSLPSLCGPSRDAGGGELDVAPRVVERVRRHAGAQPAHAHRDGLFLRVAEHLARRVVHGEERARVDVVQPHRVGRVLEDRAVALLARLERLFGALALADVAHEREDARLAADGDALQAHLDPQLLAGDPVERHPLEPHRLVRGRGALHERDRALGVERRSRVRDVRQPVLPQLVERHVAELARAPVRVEHRAGRDVVHEDGVVRVVEDGAVALLRRAQRELGRAPFGDVDRDADHAREAAVGAGHEAAGGLHEAHDAVGAHDAVVDVERLPRLHEVPHHVDDALAVLRVHEREELLLRALRPVERQPVDAELLARPHDAVGRHVVLPAPHLGEALELVDLLLALTEPLLGGEFDGRIVRRGGGAVIDGQGHTTEMRRGRAGTTRPGENSHAGARRVWVQ